MYSSDTEAHNHVNSQVLRRITYLTCQTSHTYNTLPVLFSNLLHVWSPRSAHYWQHYYMKTNNISKVSLFFEYSWGGGVKGMFLPLVSRSVDSVCFNMSPLYQIISSHQFQQLSYYIPHCKRELCKHHVRDPESTRLRKKTELLIERIDLQLLRYCPIRKCKKNNI